MVSLRNSLETISGDVSIQLNPVLRSLEGLHGLRDVGGRFVVTMNPQLCVSEIAEVGADLDSGEPEGNTSSNKDC